MILPSRYLIISSKFDRYSTKIAASRHKRALVRKINSSSKSKPLSDFIEIQVKFFAGWHAVC
jgi:hypothetical protein